MHYSGYTSLGVKSWWGLLFPQLKCSSDSSYHLDVQGLLHPIWFQLPLSSGSTLRVGWLLTINPNLPCITHKTQKVYTLLANGSWKTPWVAVISSEFNIVTLTCSIAKPQTCFSLPWPLYFNSHHPPHYTSNVQEKGFTVVNKNNNIKKSKKQE